MDRRTFLNLTAGAALATPAVVGRAAAAEPVRMRELYNRDLSFSDYALAHADQWVDIEGFMAPPLLAEAAFYVLTKMPMAICPFCDSAASWPTDIVTVYSRDIVAVSPFNVPILTSGVLKLGTYTDEELGFVSRVRLVDAEYRRI